MANGPRRNPLAQASAGFTVKVTVEPEGGFTGDLSGIKAGDQLSTVKHIAAYFRAFVTDEGEAKRLSAVRDTALIDVMKATPVEQLDDAERNAKYMDAIQSAPFMLRGAEDVPAMRTKLPAAGSAAALAITYGNMLGNDAKQVLTKAVEGQKDSDAGPIVFKKVLQETFKDVPDFIKNVPPIGTRYQDSKNDKAPFGYRPPSDKSDAHKDLPIFNGPYDYYKVANAALQGNGRETGHWTAEFVAQNIAHEYQERVFHLKALMDNAEKEKDGVQVLHDCPPELKQYKGKKEICAGLIADAAYEFNRRVRLTSQALLMWQREQAISERFNDRIRVGLQGNRIGATDEQAARMRKPIVLYDMVPDKDGTTTKEPSAPITLGSFLRIEPRKFSPTAIVADLTARTPRKGKGTEGAPPLGETQPPVTNVPAIVTTSQLEDYTSEVAAYLKDGDHYAELLRLVNDKEKGGPVASNICAIYAAIKRIAENKSVVAIANAFEESNTDQTAQEAEGTAKVA